MDDPVNFADEEKETSCIAKSTDIAKRVVDSITGLVLSLYYGVGKDWETTKGKYRKNS